MNPCLVLLSCLSTLTVAPIAPMQAAKVDAGGRSTGNPQDCEPHRVHPAVWKLLETQPEPLKVWVFFRDKDLRSERDLQAALDRVEAEYSPRAIQRRKLRRTFPGLFDERDLPVAAHYLDDVESTGAIRRRVSTWLNAVSVLASRDQILGIAQLECVRSIEPVRRAMRNEAVPITPRGPIAATPRGVFHGASHDQLEQIGIIAMHDAGYRGAGVVIGVLDTGFQRTHEAFNHPDNPINVIAEYDFVHDDSNTAFEPGDPVYTDQFGQTVYEHDHGTYVLGTIAAYNPNVLVGGAYAASFILAKTEDLGQEVPAEEDDYVAGLQFIEANGGDLATSSLGYTAWYNWFDMDGLTAVTTVGVNIATANGLVCVTAAGNGGRDQDLPTLIAPGDAFDVITCGAVSAGGNLTDFSSGGPTADGRVKPEVLARGQGVATLHPNDDTAYSAQDGTSMSTPLVASAVALLIEARPTLTVDQIRTAFFETADYFVANGTSDPQFHHGYGIIDVHAASLMGFCPGNPDCLADMDCDGDVTLLDVGPFVSALLDASGQQTASPACPVLRADMNRDGRIDGEDVSGFVDCLLAGVCGG